MRDRTIVLDKLDPVPSGPFFSVPICPFLSAEISFIFDKINSHQHLEGGDSKTKTN